MAATSHIKVAWSGDFTYELTSAYVASTAYDVRDANMAALYVVYTPATNNAVLNFQIQINPLDAASDPTNIYWSTEGYYVDSSGNQQTNSTGSWVTQAATFNSLATSTAATAYTLVPVPLNVFKAVQIRILAKETGGSTAGNVTFIFAKNDYGA